MRQVWSLEELEESWSLSVADERALGARVGANRLGFAVLSKFFELDARFPDGPEEVPVEVVAHVADLVGVRWREFDAYAWSGRSHERHRAQIRGRFGFRAATDEDAEVFTVWLIDEVASSEAGGVDGPGSVGSVPTRLDRTAIAWTYRTVGWLGASPVR